MSERARRVTVRIPAVALNLGAGYATLGLALSLKNEFRVELSPSPGVRVTNMGPYARGIPDAEENLVARAALRVLSASGCEPDGLAITAACNIPPLRGLSSSATAVVAGLAAGSRLARAPLDRSDICALAEEFGERPDAVAAALVGGAQLFVRSADEAPLCSKLPFPEGVEALLAIPELDVRSREARVGYPTHVRLEDAVFNGGRIGLLVASFFSGDDEFLSVGLEDRIHLPNLRARIPALTEISLLARAGGAIGMSVCGYGPSVLLFHRGMAKPLSERLRESFRRCRMGVRIMNVSCDRKGTEFVDE